MSIGQYEKIPREIDIDKALPYAGYVVLEVKDIYSIVAEPGSKTQFAISLDTFLVVFPKNTEPLLRERLGRTEAHQFGSGILLGNHLLCLAMGVIYGLEITELSLTEEVGSSHPVE